MTQVAFSNQYVSFGARECSKCKNNNSSLSVGIIAEQLITFILNVVFYFYLHMFTQESLAEFLLLTAALRYITSSQ